MKNKRDWEGEFVALLLLPPMLPPPKKSSTDGYVEKSSYDCKAGPDADLGAIMRLKPGQRPGRITGDHEDPRSDPRYDYYTRGSVSRREFFKLVRRFPGKTAKAKHDYLAHPYLIQCVNQWLDTLRKDGRRRARSKELRAGLHRHLHNERWPVLLSPQLVSRMLGARGFVRDKHGWSVAPVYTDTK